MPSRKEIERRKKISERIKRCTRIRVLSPKHNAIWDRKVKLLAVATAYWFKHKAWDVQAENPLAVPKKKLELFRESVGEVIKKKWEDNGQRGLHCYTLRGLTEGLVVLLELDNAYETFFYEVLREYLRKLEKSNISL